MAINTGDDFDWFGKPKLHDVMFVPANVGVNPGGVQYPAVARPACARKTRKTAISQTLGLTPHAMRHLRARALSN